MLFGTDEPAMTPGQLFGNLGKIFGGGGKSSDFPAGSMIDALGLLGGGGGGGGGGVRHVGGAGSSAASFVDSMITGSINRNAGVTAGGVDLATITTSAGKSFRVAEQYAERFQGFLSELEGTGYKIRAGHIGAGEGGYSWRGVGGASVHTRPSRHSLGEAIDINPRENPWSNKFRTDMPPGVGDMARRLGLKWGGEWNKPDTMHFQVDKNIKSIDAHTKVIETATEGTTKLTESFLGLDKMSTTTVSALSEMAGGMQQFGTQLSSFLSSAGGGGSNWFQGLMGAFGGAGGAIQSMFDISPMATSFILGGGVGLFKGGGTVGFSSGRSKMVHPSVFAGAPHFAAGGIVGDEVPIIAHKGETVVPKGGRMAPQSGMTVNIHNYAGVQVETKQSKGVKGQMELDVLIDRVVSEKMQTRGTAANNAMRKHFANRSVLKTR
jgi:hypothetical protein